MQGTDPCQCYDTTFNCIACLALERFKSIYSNIQIQPERLMKKSNINSKFTFISAFDKRTNTNVDLFIKCVSKAAVDQKQVDDIIVENCNALSLNLNPDPNIKSMFMEYITSFASYTINKYYNVSNGKMTDDEELIINQVTPATQVKYIQKNEQYISIYKKLIGHSLSECLDYVDYSVMLYAINSFLEKYIKYG
jgi:hypothetical protein